MDFYQEYSFINIIPKISLYSYITFGKRSSKLMIGPNHLFPYNTPTSVYNNYNQHHLHPFCQSFFAKHPKWLKIPPLNHSKTKVNTLMPTRKEMVDWQEIFIKQIAGFSMIIGFAEYGQFCSLFGVTLLFLSLSVEDLTTCTTIDSSKFIQLFLKNYKKAKNKLIHLPTSRVINNQSESLLYEKSSILQSLIYVPTSDPLLQINFEHITSKTLMKWLDDVTQMHVFQLSNRFVNKENPEQNLLWFNSNAFHTLESWLACEIEKKVLRFYFNRSKNGLCTKALREHLCKNQKTRYLQKFLSLKLNDIEDRSLVKYQQELTVLKIAEQMLREEKQLKLIDFSQEQTKKTKRRRKKIKRSLSDQSLNKPLSVIQTEASTNEDNYQGLQLSLLALKQDLHLNDKTDCQPQQINIPSQLPSPLKSISKSSEKTTDQMSEQQIQKLEEQNTFKQQNKNQAKELFQQNQLLEEGDQKKRRRRRKNAKNTSRIQQQLKQKVTHKIINKQLDNLLDTLSMQSNEKFQSKVVAFQRIRYVVRSIYPFSDAVLFGSNAVGLSLPTSDIDIMLLGLHYTNKDELCHYLSQIELYLNNMGWVISCSIIPQAKVPILKLQIDTMFSFLQPKIVDNRTFTQFPTVFGLDLDNIAKGSIVKVDITISSDISGASPTTQLMRSQISCNPSIQRILLALKYVLTIRGYSQNFKGGIGSYCLFIMVTAYFHHFEQRRQFSDCQIFLDILKFYGEQFDNLTKTVILPFDSNSCFIDNQSNELTQQVIFRTPLTVINPLNNTIISSNCYQYPLIKAEWRKIREQIMKIDQSIEAQIIASFSNTSDMSKLLSNQKSLERWINRVQGKMNVTVGNILSGKY